MTTLYLHIGTEKTGTTSIQEFLRVNRTALNTIGSYVPLSLGPSNHQWLPFSFSHDLTVDSFFRMHDIKTEEQRIKAQDEKKLELRDEILRSQFDRWIISSEHLQSCLVQQHELFELREELSKYFSDIKILVYLRNPIDAAMSGWSTRIKCGVSAKALVPPNERRVSIVCNHKRTLQAWANIFGRENVIAKIFHPDELLGGDVLTDFVSFIWPTININDFKLPERQNESLSALGVSILNQILSICNVKSNSEVYRYYQEIVQYVMDLTSGCGKLVPSDESTAQYNSYFMDSNAWIQQNYFPNLFDLWPIDAEKNSTRFSKAKIDTLWPTTDSLYVLSSKGIQCADEIARLIDSHSKGKINFSENYLETLKNINLIDFVEQPMCR